MAPVDLTSNSHRSRSILLRWLHRHSILCTIGSSDALGFAGPRTPFHRLLLLPKSKPPAHPRALLAAPPPVRRRSEPAPTLRALRRCSTLPPPQKLCTASSAPRPCSTLLAAHPRATANGLLHTPPELLRALLHLPDPHAQQLELKPILSTLIFGARQVFDRLSLGQFLSNSVWFLLRSLRV